VIGRARQSLKATSVCWTEIEQYKEIRVLLRRNRLRRDGHLVGGRLRTQVSPKQ
jgi:hypothetical protein